MAFELREGLRRLCAEIGWSYAVFWRAIGSPTPKHLVWEDGHWYGKSQLSVCDNVSSRVNLLAEFQNQGECSIDELVCKSMVPQVHVIGDGIVGLAASTGNHQWILRDVARDRESILSHLAELKNQFLSGIQTVVIIPMLPHGVVQFGSTIRVMENNLFVNHVRTSFTQLVCEPGSYVVVQEALCQSSLQHAFLNMDNSFSMRCNHQLSLSSAKRTLSETSSSLSTLCQGNLSKIDVERLSCHPMIHRDEKSLPHLSNRLENGPAKAQAVSHRDMMPAANGMTLTTGNLSIMEENFRSVCGSRAQEPTIGIKASVEDMLAELDTYSMHPKFATIESTNDHGIFTSAPVCTKGDVQNPFCNASGANSQGSTRNINTSNGNQGISESPLANNPSNKCLGMLISGYPKQKHDFPLPNDFSFRSCYGRAQECMLGSSSIVGASLGIESANSHLNHSHHVENVQSKGVEIDSGPFHLHNDNSSHFVPHATSRDDLFDLLGLYSSLDGRLASEQQLAVDVTSCNTQVNSPTLFYPVNNDLSCAEIFSVSNTDQLLDAVVSKINPGSRQSIDENISCKTSTTKYSDSSNFCSSHNNDGSASSGKKYGEYVSPSILTSNAETAASTSVPSADSMDETERSGCYKSQIFLRVEGGQKMKSNKLFDSHIERVDEVSKVNRKRLRSGEVPRPRPKDRQLIMDRVKELRELVPNGAKCSIDALLEKTITHMLFLQMVAKHANKLRDSGEPKIVSKDGGVLLKDNFQGGATWAFEVGSQPMTCPIIVEDLNPPREMLVEMLCEERGVFLEIADLIRGLGLTILKGVMEAKKNKIWARFAVEANRDVTRMEIFLSLVRSLEPTIGSGASSHSIHNSNIPNKIFNPSCVPVTGISDPFH